MNIETAINKLQVLQRYSYEPETELARKALLLGIQALIRHQDKASLTYAGMLQPLPGETEGVDNGAH